MTDSTPTLRLELLGKFRVHLVLEHGGIISVRGRSSRALLVYLAFHAGQTIPRTRLAGLLWPDEPEAVARHNLRQTLSELRASLGKSIEIAADKETLRLEAANIATDVSDFVRNCDTPSVENLKAAAAAYAGPLTSGFEIDSSAFEEWAAVERHRLHVRALDAFDLCIRLLSNAGRNQEALVICERLLALDPLRERTHQLLISLEHHVNGRSSALSRAGMLAVELREQLGVFPERATQDLVETIRSQNSSFRFSPAMPSSRFAWFKLWPHKIVFAASAAIAAVVFFGGLALWDGSNRTTAVYLPDEDSYSVAVLPFAARSDGNEIEQFLHLLERDIADTLSHMPRFLTISHLTMRSYRATTNDARKIGRELNVKYLLTGDAYAEDGEIVLRVRLIDTESGAQLWSNRYNHRLGQKQNVLEELAISLGHQFRTQIVISEGLRKERLDRENPSYSDFLERGFAEFYQASDTDDYRTALALFEKAHAINPKSAAVKVAIARILSLLYFESRADRVAYLRRAEDLLTSALQDSPQSASAYFGLGVVRKLQGLHAESLPLLEQALKLNPSDVNTYVQLGHSLIFVGRAQETERYIEKAIRRGPLDRGVPNWNIFAGQADLHIGRFDKAIARFKTAIGMNPDLAPAHYLLTAAYYMKNDMENAVLSAKELKRRFPRFKPEELVLKGYTHPIFSPERARQIEAIGAAIELSEASAGMH